MNKGNYEHDMKESTTVRSHTTPKRVLRYADVLGISQDKCSVDDFRGFLSFIDSLDSVSEAESCMTMGKWKRLFATLCSLRDNTNVNYCIYENVNGILFDITTHTVEYKEAEYKEAEALMGRESNEGKLHRLKLERGQIELKINHLLEKKKEVNDRIAELVQLIAGDEFQVVRKEVV